jgi:hypothetical protein
VDSSAIPVDSSAIPLDSSAIPVDSSAIPADSGVIPADSSGIQWNGSIPAGISGARQSTVWGHGLMHCK